MRLSIQRTVFSLTLFCAAMAMTVAAPIEIDPEARALIDRASAAHQALQSFSGTIEIETETQGQKGLSRTEVAFRKPDRAVVVTTSTGPDGTPFLHRAVADGKNLYFLSPLDKKHYQKLPLSSSRLRGFLFALSRAMDKGVRTLLLGGLLPEEMWRSVQSMEIGPPGEIGGVRVDTVICTALWENEINTVTFALGKEDHLLRRRTLQWKTKGQSITQTVTFTKMKANPVLPDARFVFTPPPGRTAKPGADISPRRSAPSKPPSRSPL